MDDIELVFNGEIFRISEDIGPYGKSSYRFSWLNGPSGGIGKQDFPDHTPAQPRNKNGS